MAISYAHLVTVANKAFETLIKRVNPKKNFFLINKIAEQSNCLLPGKHK
jgi:hypothetical protein